jgi:hypothetical protein
MDGEPGRPEVELAKNGDDGGNLSWPGFLWCRGGGPREVAKDEGLPVLLGACSARTKGSTGACVAWHAEANEEKWKRGWVSPQHAGKDKRGVGGRPAARCRVAEESVGGPDGWQGARPAEVVAGLASAT